MLRHVLRFTLVTGAFVAAACVDHGPVSPASNTAAPGSPTMQLVAGAANAKSYIIDFTGNGLPSDLAAQVTKAGGTLTTSIGQGGVAVATSDVSTFADRAG